MSRIVKTYELEHWTLPQTKWTLLPSRACHALMLTVPLGWRSQTLLPKTTPSRPQAAWPVPGELLLVSSVDIDAPALFLSGCLLSPPPWSVSNVSRGSTVCSSWRLQLQGPRERGLSQTSLQWPDQHPLLFPRSPATVLLVPPIGASVGP